MKMFRSKNAGMILPLFLSLIIVFSSPTMSNTSQSARARDQSQDTAYVCPMHPEVTSDKPGNCPKCGMKLVKKTGELKSEVKMEMSASEKIKKAKALLAEAKEELGKEGKYNCCIEPECNKCALEHQSCSCHKSLKAGKPVCNECYAGWQRGEGVDKKIKKSQVKTSYGGHSH